MKKYLEGLHKLQHALSSEESKDNIKMKRIHKVSMNTAPV